MPDIKRMETPARVLPNIDKFPPLELQTDMVDSMSPPHVAEYASAQHALTEDCTTLQLVDHEIEECRMRIARVHAQMRLLERQRDVIQRRVAIHRARLSPLREIPDQILQEVFQRCLPDTPYAVPDARSAPLILTHVCRRWRTVVQGTSELWSSIAIHDRGVWNYELEVEMVKRWLDRSRTRPIRMSITCPPRTDFGLDGDVSSSDIFQLAIAHSAHTEDLCLNVNKTYLYHFLHRARLPALQSIVALLHSVHRTDELEINAPAFFSAPILRRITFEGDGASFNLIPCAIFPQITHLSLDCDTTSDFALLLQDFPHLQHLTLSLSLSRDDHRVHFPPHRDHRIVVPSLLSLEVCLDKDMLDFGHPGRLETLLDQLALPALHTLSIAAPLRPRCDARTGRTEARWEDHVEWVRSRSVAALLRRSRHTPRPRFECRDLASSGGVQVVVLQDVAVGENSA